MERIRLIEEERQALRGIRSGTMQDDELRALADVVASLQSKGLVEARFEGQELRRVRLSLFGAFYFRSNPKLRNPIDWQRITAWAAIVAAVAGVFGLFVGCSLLRGI